jgi:hypothetical protein
VLDRLALEDTDRPELERRVPEDDDRAVLVRLFDVVLEPLFDRVPEVLLLPDERVRRAAPPLDERLRPAVLRLDARLRPRWAPPARWPSWRPCSPSELDSDSSSSLLISFFATPTAAGIATPTAAPAATFLPVDIPSSCSDVSSFSGLTVFHLRLFSGVLRLLFTGLGRAHHVLRRSSGRADRSACGRSFRCGPEHGRLLSLLLLLVLPLLFFQLFLLPLLFLSALAPLLLHLPSSSEMPLVVGCPSGVWRNVARGFDGMERGK